jgi:hypothetical protein
VASLNVSRPAINAIQDIGTLNPPATAAATIGTPVTKRGRTTGRTYGTVDTVDATIELWDGGARRIFRQQIGVWRQKASNWMFIAPGDSGSVLIDNSGLVSVPRVLGLLFAGSTGNPFIVDGAYAWANPINAVRFSLGIDIFAPKPKEKDKEKDTKEKDWKEEEEKDSDKLSPKEEESNIAAEGLLGGREQPGFGRSAAYGRESGPLSERLTRLEASVDELRHFVLSRDRPDVRGRQFGDAESSASSPRESEDERGS